MENNIFAFLNIFSILENIFAPRILVILWFFTDFFRFLNRSWNRFLRIVRRRVWLRSKAENLSFRTVPKICQSDAYKFISRQIQNSEKFVEKSRNHLSVRAEYIFQDWKYIHKCEYFFFKVFSFHYIQNLRGVENIFTKLFCTGLNFS